MKYVIALAAGAILGIVVVRLITQSKGLKAPVDPADTASPDVVSLHNRRSVPGTAP